MMDSSGRATAHTSATMLTASCPRRVWLEQNTEYYVNPLRVFPAWRGTMGHKMTEANPQPDCIYERRFESIITINGKDYSVTGAIDKLDITNKHIEDFKTKADSKINKLQFPEEAHVWQLNVYRWLVWNGWPQVPFTHNKKRYKVGKPANIEIDSLKLVYWSMEKPKDLYPHVKPLDEVYEYIVERLLNLVNGLPDIPADLDPFSSPICCDWCAVRKKCVEKAIGF